ncbi:hypothetical protein MPDQ_000389 [Monascus purpureus]|uniref:TauD/TfdA-like domain-containing protein n=1 Tax=Monascus purpureus TaxID=5098 RepID=A0A507QPZ7_MONPU|nr:hypothetical protein MPDQ_000389 [Monascus purpureus]
MSRSLGTLLRPSLPGRAVSSPSAQLRKRSLASTSSKPSFHPNINTRIGSQTPQHAPAVSIQYPSQGRHFSFYHFRPQASSEPIQEPVPGVQVFPTYLTVDVDGKVSFDFAHLRDACKCPTCVDQYSKQRNFRTSDIPLSIQPRNIKWDGEQLEIQWSDDIPGYDESHVSIYDRKFLKYPVAYALDDTSPRRYRYLWDGPKMQKLQHWISYEDYMKDDAKFAAAMKDLSVLGLIFIKDIPDSREELEKITERIGPLRNTFYGRTWDVRSVPKARNVAYTNVFLGFHMDLMYMNEPPCFQLLHCLQNSCEGGESMFADSFLTASRLRQLRPEYFKILERFPVHYEYVHKDQVYHHVRPVIESRRSPDGHSHIHRVNYSPPFQGPLPRTTKAASFGSNYKGFREALNFFTKLLEEESYSFELKLEPGQCVIFENRRTLHARRQFNTESGHRWLAGSYLDEDVVLSQYRVLKRTHPEIWSQKVFDRS